MNLKEYNLSLYLRLHESLEEALEAMMESKRGNPHSIVYLCPNDELLDKKWNEDSLDIHTAFAITNNPHICVDICCEECDSPCYTPESPDKEMEYISEVARSIRQHFNVKGNEGWRLSVIEADTDSEVELFIAPESWDEVCGMVNDYNSRAVEHGYQEALSLDRERMCVTGLYEDKTVNGGFFEKRRIRKQNEAQRKIYWTLIDTIIDKLRRI